MFCAFLTIADLGDFVSDDELAAADLRSRGWRVAMVPWTAQVDWNQFDLVIIRTTWDYQEQPQHFLQVLREIESSRAILHNPLAVVRWNLDKRYLADLQRWGVPIVDTIFAQDFSGQSELEGYFDQFAAQKIIIKPRINVNAYNTFLVSRMNAPALVPQLQEIFARRPYLVQPFMKTIQVEGEYSLIFINNKFSHAICKRPRSGDFRVQEEHGGVISPQIPNRELLTAGRRALDALGQPLLYARVDLVRHKEDYLVMELELIEPSLYLRMDAGAATRFADAIESAGNDPRQ